MSSFQPPHVRGVENSSDYDESVDTKPCCSICEYALDHEVYQIFEHPVLPVAVCILCFRKLQGDFQRLEEEAEDPDDVIPSLSSLCSWCGASEDLVEDCMYLCANEESCNRAYCRACICRNLGDEEVAKLAGDDKDWQCYACCASTQRILQPMAETLDQLQDQSIYSPAMLFELKETIAANRRKKTKPVSSSFSSTSEQLHRGQIGNIKVDKEEAEDESDEENWTDEDMRIEQMLMIHKALIAEEKDALLKLEDDALREKRNEIQLEKAADPSRDPQ